jgi:hypothetical protein
MASQLETVRIKAAGPQGYMTINKADYDPKKHNLWVEPKPNDGKGDGK